MTDAPTPKRRAKGPARAAAPVQQKAARNFPTLADKALEVERLLRETYGDQAHTPRREPMHELVSTILSQRTTWQNEDLAYRRMRERFPTWADVENAPVDALADAISPSNFAEVKAPNIKRTLAAIREARGDYDITFLADLPTPEGLAWLLALPGVGLKTATLVLLFCFAKPVLPVDTHVHRVSQRLGLIGPKVMHEAAHRLLLDLLPHDPPLLYNYHVNMLRHGQKVCTFARPYCSRCTLREVCDYFADPATEKY